MHIIKLNLKTAKHPLQQFANRVYEQRMFSAKQTQKDLVLKKSTGIQNIKGNFVETFTSVTYRHLSLKVKAPDCFIYLKNKVPSKIEKLFLLNGQPFVLYRQFKNFASFFNEPCSSKLLLCGSVGRLSLETEVASLSDILCKAIKIDIFFISLLHNSDS